MPDHVHMLLAIPPKYSVSSVMGLSEGEKLADGIRQAREHEDKFGNRKFWAEGYYVSTVGLNEATIAKYIREPGEGRHRARPAERQGVRGPLR